MKDGYAKIIIAVIFGFIIIKTCSNNRNRNYQYYQQETWQKSPVDKLVRSLSNEPNFSIILYDMNAEDQNSSSPTYQQKYRIIIPQSDTVLTKETQWYTVSPAFFHQYINDMGMEIASKKNGVLHKEVAPAGYSNYIGNPQYGHWVQNNGSSFWAFYGRYAFMSSMFNLMTYPVRRSYWDDYYYGGYYGTGRAYYGPSGRHIYGTRSYTASSAGRNSTWGSKPSDFKSRVRSSVARSARAARSRSYSSSSRYRMGRNASRSSRYSTFRSRGGGFGK